MDILLRKAIKEDGTYYLNGRVVQKILKAVSKTPSRNKVDRDFRTPLSKGLFPDMETVMDPGNKFKLDKVYSDQVFQPMTAFVKNLSYDKRLVRNKNKDVTEDKLHSDRIRNYQPERTRRRRASIVEAIRKLASTLLNLGS